VAGSAPEGAAHLVVRLENAISARGRVSGCYEDPATALRDARDPAVARALWNNTRVSVSWHPSHEGSRRRDAEQSAHRRWAFGCECGTRGCLLSARHEEEARAEVTGAAASPGLPPSLGGPGREPGPGALAGPRRGAVRLTASHPGDEPSLRSLATMLSYRLDGAVTIWLPGTPAAGRDSLAGLTMAYTGDALPAGRAAEEGELLASADGRLASVVSGAPGDVPAGGPGGPLAPGGPGIAGLGLVEGSMARGGAWARSAAAALLRAAQGLHREAEVADRIALLAAAGWREDGTSPVAAQERARASDLREAARQLERHADIVLDLIRAAGGRPLERAAAAARRLAGEIPGAGCDLPVDEERSRQFEHGLPSASQVLEQAAADFDAGRGAQGRRAAAHVARHLASHAEVTACYASMLDDPLGRDRVPPGTGTAAACRQAAAGAAGLAARARLLSAGLGHEASLAGAARQLATDIHASPAASDGRDAAWKLDRAADDLDGWHPAGVAGYLQEAAGELSRMADAGHRNAGRQQEHARLAAGTANAVGYRYTAALAGSVASDLSAFAARAGQILGAARSWQEGIVAFPAWPCSRSTGRAAGPQAARHKAALSARKATPRRGLHA
jgi:hypothetical protein